MPTTITVVELTAEDEEAVVGQIAARQEAQRAEYEKALAAIYEDEQYLIRALRQNEVARRVLKATHPGAPRG